MRVFSIIFIVFIVFSCSNKKSEYKKLNDGSQIKLLSFGENEKKNTDIHSVLASIQLYSNELLVYYQDEYSLIEIDNFPLKELFNELNEGDSAMIKISTKEFNAKSLKISTDNLDDTLIGYIKIVKYLDNEQEKEYLNNYDAEIAEQQSIKKYLTFFNNSTSKNGVTFIPIESGEGEVAEFGNTVLLKYRGFFQSGIEFDNTNKQNHFEYQLGTPNQLIQGLEIAITGMKKKEKAKIIIPSRLAFGEKGSSTGIVPPYTTVVYDIEIVNIK